MPKKKATIKSIIQDGIKAGWGGSRILNAVAKKHPDSQADMTHVKYYSGHLKRAGDITQAQHDKYLEKPRKSGDAPVKKVTKAASKKKVETKPSKKKVEKKPSKKVVETKPAAKKAPKKVVKKAEVKKVVKKVKVQKVKKQEAA